MSTMPPPSNRHEDAGATEFPASIGLDPLAHEWLTDESDGKTGRAVIYVCCSLADGTEFAHVLFEADWGTTEHAEHVANLHNRWLAERKEAESNG